MIITHKQQFEVWQDHFNRLKDISECCHLFEKCSGMRMYFGFTEKTSIEFDVPSCDNQLAKRIVSFFPTWEWKRKDDRWRVDYIGTASNGLQIHLHHAEKISERKYEVSNLEVPVFCPECEQEKEDDGKRLCPICIEALSEPEHDPRGELMDARRDAAYERSVR